MAKKSKISEAYKKQLEYATNKIKARYDLTSNETLIESIKQLETKNKKQLLPKKFNGVDELGVAYGRIGDDLQISFFNKTKCASCMDAFMKANMRLFDDVGDDCLIIPLKNISNIIPPGTNPLMGSMDFDVFRTRWAVQYSM